MDFAGGIVVHATAGTAAIVAALMLGKTQSFPTSLTPPHSPRANNDWRLYVVGWLVRL